MLCHLLDVGSIWMREFGAALCAQTPAVCWLPQIRNTGLFETWQKEILLSDPALTVRHFPLQRGYARWPLSALARIGPRLSGMLRDYPGTANASPLICTTPYYAPVAEAWLGPVIYYQTDLTIKYAGVNASQIRSLDRTLCRVATAVCPNSRRIADYMISEAHCDPRKITIVPNATRASNIFAIPPLGPQALPESIAGATRPIAGVIGNLAANLDWQFLLDVVAATPAFTWIFVGPTHMPIHDPVQARARNTLMHRKGRVHFTGSQPYGVLREYARSFDVAILPYLGKEPTYSGSSTRFYEHLAACRPMIATHGFEELLHKEPLLRLAASAPAAVEILNDLHTTNFHDGYEEMRWAESRSSTWDARAAALLATLNSRAIRSDECAPAQRQR